MAKKSKNSKLLVHYTRTMTPENLSRAANYVGEYVLKGLGALGKIMTAPLTGGPLGPTTVVLPKTKKLLDAERKLREIQEELIGKAMTWVSPLNYGAALATGNGLNARKGEEEVASWSPAWLAAARLGELYVGPKAVKGVKATPRVVVNTAAKAGVKPAKAAVVAREINKGIKQNTNNGRIEVTGNYFNSPDKWYRITERPEKIGIEEQGKNVTTADSPETLGTINGWRTSVLDNPIETGKGVNEGYFVKKPKKINLSLRRTHGRAHGNTSQAAKGQLWQANTAGSNIFPGGVIEGEAPLTIPYGLSRTHFVNTPWEEVPTGGRIGFHTGEMPMSNLGWFQKTNKGTYTYEPIIPEKRINFTPTKLLEPSKTSSTIQISPEELYKVLKGQELNGYYFMGHGTGRSNVNPQIIFDNGLRIKNGDIGNTTSPISLSNLSLWPHANSKEIIILPGRAGNVKFDSARGRIPSDWYDDKIFQWNDNPGFEGSGLFAVLKPNATFVETEINGVPGVYTKPEAILGSYNIDTQTLKLNPRSLYEFLFNVPKLAEPSTSLKFFERKPFNSKLKKSEEAGVPKGERAENNPEVMQNARLFAEKYGYDIPENIDQVKDMYRLHNRFFRTVTTEPFDINPDLYPELKGLSHEQKIKLLASKGYPKFYRSWDPKDVGSGFNDDFVFVSPSVALNIKYSYGDLSNTVMLQRPFSFGKPNEWHINADWKINPSTLNIHTKGMISEGNAPIYDEVKISTEHLIPIKIAEKTDKGSLKKKQGGKMNIIKLFKNGGLIRKMETAAGGPIKKPIKRLKDGYRYIPDEENGGWDRISDNSMSDVFATMEFTPKKTKTNSSITRKQSAPSKTYYSAYNPDDVVKGFNTLTLGGLNNLSPTQWARRVYDTGKLLTGNMTWSGYTNSWINGNNGLVSLDFKEEHPVLSNSINGGIDLATFSLPKVSLYPVHVALLIATPIAGSYIGTKLGEEVDKYLPEKIQGYGGMLGYMLGGSAGIGAAYKNFSTTPLIHTKYKKLNDVINYPITTAAATIKGKYPWTKKQDIRLKRQLFDDIEEARNFLLKSGYQLEDLPAIRIAKKPQYLEGELGHYSPYYNTVTVKSTINPYSNLPIESIESVGSGFKGLVNHELTHGRLQYFGAFSEYDPKAGYYIPRKDIKTPVLDPFRRKKAGSWTASPDEFDAELSNLLISTGKLPIESVDNILPLQIRFGIWNKNKAREIENLMLLLRKNQEFFKDGGKINAIEQFKKRLTNS